MKHCRGKAEAKAAERWARESHGEWGAACFPGVTTELQCPHQYKCCPFTPQSTSLGDRLSTPPQGLCPEQQQPSPKQTFGVR